MTWHETAPGIHEARGTACRLTVSRVVPERDDLWAVVIDWGLTSPLLSAEGHQRGTLWAAQVYALSLVHNLGHNLMTDAANLAGSMNRTINRATAPAPEVGG